MAIEFLGVRVRICPSDNGCLPMVNGGQEVELGALANVDDWPRFLVISFDIVDVILLNDGQLRHNCFILPILSGSHSSLDEGLFHFGVGRFGFRENN